MLLTLDETVENQDRLRREIVERECLLAAFDVLHGYVANGRAPKSIELGSIVSALSPAKPALLLGEEAATLPPPPVPAALPAPAPAPRYIHPDLAPFTNLHGGNTNAVSWAIKRMTDDYSLRDLHSLLTREGYSIRPDQISVILTRMRNTA